MNDAFDEVHKHVPPKRQEHEWAHLDPSRWWFASSAFPMLAGTLGPVASAFSICALVKYWRQSYPPGTDIDSAPFISDPRWLTAINAVQLAIAVIANMALLLNMTRRLSFSIAQPVTIVGWYMSSFTLIALTSTAAGPLVVESEDFVWSQAFYYAIYSAVLYFLVASLMVVTFLGAQAGRYPKDFMLTPSQRTLMLQTIMLLMYLLVGALIFCNVEDWDYLDAVYWAAVTLFTVGFGDFYAKTPLGRALLIPYALIGIISLGLVIGSIRSLVLDRAKTRLGARMVELKRRRTLRRMTRRGTDDILVPIREAPTIASVRSDSSGGLTEFERREREFKLMRTIQTAAARRRRWMALFVSAGTWLVLWLLGAKVFQACEDRYQGWDYFTGVYFAYVSLTTIGYGDVTPVSNAGKSFWVFWALLALPTTTVLISNAGDTVVKVIREATDKIATVTILPSDRGFRKDLKQLLRMLSFGTLFTEDENVEQEPPGFLGHPQRLKPSVTHNGTNNGNDDAEENMHQDEADLEAEGANPDRANEKRARRDESEEDHARTVEANAADETDPSPRQSRRPSRDPDSPSSPTSTKNNTSTSNTKITFSTPSHHHHSHRSTHRSRSEASSTPRSPTNNSSTYGAGPIHRTHSIPRTHLPLIPNSKVDYHIVLIDEIGRVTQHLRHRPPRKYTFHEWAWYLRLIGEDEGDAERHRKANPHVHGKKDRMLAGRGNSPLQNGQQGNSEGSSGSGSGEEGAGKKTVNGHHHHHHHRRHQHGHNKDGQGQEGGGGEVDGNRKDSDKTGKEEVVAVENKESGRVKEKVKDDQPLPWSWVGSRSPLMGSQEEAEWILERLVARLGEELRGVKSRGQGCGDHDASCKASEG